MKTINDKFIGALKDYSMIQNGDKIIVAVSGGADSMCLLHLLNGIKTEKKLELTVAHVNHCLRGDESDLDEKLVKSVCESLGIEYKSIRVDVRKEANEQKKGIEEVARNIRYSFFEELVGNTNAKIATAHNLSDNVETILFNLTRGTSPKGVIGIKPVRDNIIRPLIYISKVDITSFCQENNILYREDKSNNDTVYTRNKIRHLVIPVLKEINSNFEGNMQRLVMQEKMQAEYIAKQVKLAKDKCLIDENCYSVQELKELDTVIFNELIADLLPTNVDTRKIGLIFDIVNKSSGTVEIKDNFRARIIGDKLLIGEEEKENDELIEWNIPFAFGEVITPFGDKFTIKLLQGKEIKNSGKWFKKLINYDTINKSTVIRFRNSADKFVTYGNNFQKSYKKLMQERQIPKNNRNKLLILANDDEILWIDKVGASNIAACNKTTKQAILIIKQGEDEDA